MKENPDPTVPLAIGCAIGLIAGIYVGNIFTYRSVMLKAVNHNAAEIVEGADGKRIYRWLPNL